MTTIEAPKQVKRKPTFITDFFAQAGAKQKKTKSASSSRVQKTSANGSKLESTQRADVQTLEVHVAEIERESSNTGSTEIGIAGKSIPEEKDTISSPTARRVSHDKAQGDYTDFCAQLGFDKKKWVESLSDEQKLLLSLEIHTLHVTWLAFLHKELTKPYFLALKRFLQSQKNKTVFPPPGKIYSWSHYTPLPEVKCLILGQDPYHNFNQAHGLAFSVMEPTRPPPSLLNIYKALKIDFPSFEVPDYNALSRAGNPGGGNLTKWAQRGVLMLNACLTVEAHKANSHANQGWEQFTEKVIETAISFARNQNQGFVIMAWGTPAQKRVEKFSSQLSRKDVSFLVLKSVHPSPLSANRGFFDSHVFMKCNEWLRETGKRPINWGLLEGNNVE